MFIAVGIIAVLAVVVIAVYFRVSSTNRKIAAEKLRKQRKWDANKELVLKMFRKVEPVGKPYVLGKTDPKISHDKLFAAFRGDDRFYNIVFARNYKNKHNKPKKDYRKLNPEITSVGIRKDKSEQIHGIVISMGYASNDKTQEIVTAQKEYPPEDPKSKVNLGGHVMVIVKAVKKY